KVGMIRLRRGDADAARAMFDRAEVELAEVGSAEERARLLDASARARMDRADQDGAEAKARAGLELIGPAGPDDLKSLLHCTLGTVAFHRGDWAAAERELVAAVAEGRASGRPELIRRALSALATTFWKVGRWDESEALERECLAEAERSRDLWAITSSSTNLAILWCGRGDFAAARPHFERSLEIHRRLGSPGGQALAHLNLGECDEILGRFDEAENNYRLMLDLLGDDRSNKNVLEARLALGNLLRKKGDLEQAQRLLVETLDSAYATSDRDLIAAVIYPLSLVEKDREHLDDARRHLDQVLAEMDASGTKDGLGRVLWSSSDLALKMGDLERAEREAGRGHELAKELGDRYDTARLKSIDARLAHAAGRMQESDRLFEEGLRLLSDVGALYDLGRCYYEWGVRTEDHAKASARLGTAARLFERIGARRELERTRGVLERLAARITADLRPSQSEGVIGLYEVSRIINSTRELTAALDETLDLALKRLNAERGMVLLTDPVTGRVSIRAARNLKTGREEEAEAISRSVVDRVVSEGRSVLAADARVDPRFVGRESILAHSIVSFLCVPLRLRDRISGAIYIDHRTAARLFSESDRAFLEAFADLAAVAIENARLVEELLEARLRLSVENESLKANLVRGSSLDALVGTSEAARRIKATLPRAAAGNATVLIRGESGSGKNLVARILHALSSRANGPFIQFNCAALPDTLAESELFGHEKGSFTGADRRKPGRFELANGGTIFLDEIGKATLSIQAKLLRVVEDKEFERVGGTQTLKTDAKILAATNLDIENAIARGEFREDLYYRLNVVPVELPPLRKRLEDLPGLVEYFVVKLSRDLGSDPRRLDPSVLSLFARYPWPGNIRELEATLHRALVLTPGDALTAGDFPWLLESPHLEKTALPAGVEDAARTLSIPNQPIDPESFDRILTGVEKDLIERALKEAGGKLREASRRTGLARNTLKSKMTKYGLRGQDQDEG
ncbi:MAG: sigma 54-interacting transcriptional regulator, partial [Acidobacteria bacterium]|nr:sigma 54-interacting transcriptional regulator [Acidobacteriota bacterium]